MFFSAASRHKRPCACSAGPFNPRGVGGRLGEMYPYRAAAVRRPTGTTQFLQTLRARCFKLVREIWPARNASSMQRWTSSGTPLPALPKLRSASGSSAAKSPSQITIGAMTSSSIEAIAKLSSESFDNKRSPLAKSSRTHFHLLCMWSFRCKHPWPKDEVKLKD